MAVSQVPQLPTQQPDGMSTPCDRARLSRLPAWESQATALPDRVKATLHAPAAAPCGAAAAGGALGTAAGPNASLKIFASGTPQSLSPWVIDAIMPGGPQT